MTYQDENQFTTGRKRIRSKIFLIVSITLPLLAVAVLLITTIRHAAKTDTLSTLTNQYADKLTADLLSNTTPSAIIDPEEADDPYFGSLDASVRIVEFADFECPFCKEAVATVKSLEQFGDKIFFQYRDFPVLQSHPNSVDAAIAANCAFAQGADAFWRYHDRLYQFQEDFSDEVYLSLAERIGLDEVAFAQCYEARTPEVEIENDLRAGESLGVPGTPTFFINGKMVPGVIPPETLVKVVQELLAQEKN